jgi:probable F420-dependent oxidoreductase
MRIGVVFPQTAIGGDVGAVRAYAQAAADLGFTHVLAYDHVVGADPAVHKGWTGAYEVQSTFHEPFVLFGYLAALTNLELVTSVIIAPQRQTALLAKQASQVDLLSGGRLRLGLGIGWNRVEYEALGQDFSQRGRRLNEQVELLRRLWTERSVTHQGRYDTVTGAGIAPLPVQRPIPLWFGAESAPGYRRVGRLGDGWFPQMAPGPELENGKAAVKGFAVEAGRDPESIGMEGRLRWRADLDELRAEAEQWRIAGATHIALNTMGVGLATAEDHLAALDSAATALGLHK